MVLHEKVWIGREICENSTRYVRYYDDSITAVRSAVRVTQGCEVKVGLHQGSALSPCLFAMVMDRMTDDIREEAPWTMMFADDIVICSESQGWGRLQKPDYDYSAHKIIDYDYNYSGD